MRQAFLPLLIILTGCASIPIGLKIAGLATTGMSYLSTGKSLPDNAFSVVTQSDCKVLRALAGDPVCSGQAPALAAEQTQPALPPVTTVAAVAITARAAHEATPRPSSDGQYLVIGSFEKRENAEKWAAFNAEFGTDVRTGDVADRAVYRVLVGPMDREATTIMREILAAVGIRGPWRMSICRNAATIGACPPIDGANVTRVAKI